MKAFHGDIKIKEKYVNRVKSHAKADSIIQGKGWENGKGCAVGCTLENYQHSQYPIELGIPEWLARLEDILFEGMSSKDAKAFPLAFLKNIKVGADLESVKKPFIIYLLKENLKTLDSLKVSEEYVDVISSIEQSKSATKQMIKAQESNNEEQIQAADSVAYSARSAVYSAADSVADSAWSVAYSARSAAYSARSAADSVAYSAAYSAWSVAYSARSAVYSVAYSARSAAYSAVYKKHADKLLKLLKACK